MAAVSQSIIIPACLFSLLFSAVIASSNVCYTPNGAEIASETFRPCFPSTNQTHCCDENETCLSNGLCLVKWDTSLNTGGCTDSTWNSVHCFPHCVPSHLGTISTLYRCSNNNWCCSDGGNTSSCCHDPQVNLFKILHEALVQNGTAFVEGYNIAADEDIVGTAVPSSTIVCSQTAVSTTTQCPSATATSSSDRVTATGLGVGLGIGIPLLAATGLLSFLLFREKKKSRKLGEQNTHGNDKSHMMTSPPVSLSVLSPHSHESSFHSHQNGFAEADSRQRGHPQELSGKEYSQAQFPQIPELPGHK